MQEAQLAAPKLVNSFLDGPIVGVETTDQAMYASIPFHTWLEARRTRQLVTLHTDSICRFFRELIRCTSLSDPDSWRRAEQRVTSSERKYVQEIHGILDEWRAQYKENNGSRDAFVYNFRTGNCIYYDLGR